MTRRLRFENAADRPFGQNSTEDTDSSGVIEQSDVSEEISQDQDSSRAGSKTEDNADVLWWRRLGQGAIDEDIVITGVSGRFPESANVTEFEKNLFGGVDMITEDSRRWEMGWHGLPRRSGKLKELNRFDASFFNVSPKQATNMDPQMRILMEVVYETILDAGYDPKSLRGSRTGVFVGVSGSESELALSVDPEQQSGYGLIGCTRSMVANRISFAFDFGGPSFPVDTACSSSLLALQLAVDSIRHGDCDSAIVAGSQLTLNPYYSLAFTRLGMTSNDGKCKSFDANGEGYVRSEAVVAILLQKSSVARRSYATVVHAKSNTDGFKEAGITVPNGDRQMELLESVYRECGVDPNDVQYVEAHGTGTKVGDPQEARAIAEVFCKNRNTPLLIGSTKSNMGHPEPASALCSLTKVLLAMERGLIPPNLHFTSPNPYIPSLVDGRLKVVTSPTPWQAGYVGINSFGFGGANSHVLLKASNIVRGAESQENSIPRLLCAAGRTEEGVKNILQTVDEHSEPEFMSFVSRLANQNAEQACYRGYLITNRDGQDSSIHYLDTVDSESYLQKVPLTSLSRDESKKPGDQNRPVCFIYPGMGSQWTGMAQKLMRLNAFRHSIQKSAVTVQPLGIDLCKLLSSDDPNTLKNTMHCMVTITAIQIALTDVLRQIGISPTMIIGHSAGEMACGYADQCLTRQQTMALAYYRGQAIINGELSGSGAMAAVGLSWEETQKKVPDGVHLACHNSADSVTVSGDFHKVHDFVAELKKEEIFARVLDSSGVAFHSPNMQKVKSFMTTKFKKIIPDAKLRSQKWISSSIPSSDWEGKLSSYCSADYQVNNAMSQVLFYEALQHIPDNAVTIEIGPSAVMTSILRSTLSDSCTNIGLLKKNHENELDFLLSSIGKVYEAGMDVHVNTLYEEVAYPVPTGTPQISSLMQWDHRTDWFVADYKGGVSMGNAGNSTGQGSYVLEPFDHDSIDGFLTDHNIDGRLLYPFTGYIVLAWRTLAKINGLEMDKTPFLLENFSVSRPAMLTDKMRFDVSISPGEGRFEVLEGGMAAASGKITLITDNHHPMRYADIQCELGHPQKQLKGSDIYKELHLRGYEYGDSFKLINTLDGEQGNIFWQDNWVTFLDATMQTFSLVDNEDTLKVPTLLRYLRVDPIMHKTTIQQSHDNKQFVEFKSHIETQGILIGGVELAGLSVQTVSRQPRASGELYLEKTVFTRYFDENCLSSEPQLQTEIMEYQLDLSAVAFQALKSVTKAFDIDIYIDILIPEKASSTNETSTNTNSHILKRPLIDLCRTILDTDSIDSKSSEFDKLTKLIIDTDRLYSTNNLQGMLKPFIDIPIQNTGGHHLKYAVLEPINKRIMNDLIFNVLSHPQITAEWLIIGSDLSEFDNEYCLVNSIQKFEHKLTVAGAKEYQRQFDVIFCQKVLFTNSNINDYLDILSGMCRPDGFMIVTETSKNFHLTAAFDILRLNGQLPAASDKTRVLGMYQTHEQWLGTFHNSGLRTVMAHTDPALSSSTYLLHRRPEQRRIAELINVDDVDDFEWLEPMQKLVAESEHAEETDKKVFWMTSNSTRDNGLLGLSLCLRDESAKENAYRMIMNTGLADDAPDMTSDQMLAQMEHDLHSNIYRDGCMGALTVQTVPQEEQTARRVCEHAFVNTTVKGEMKSLQWIESDTQFFGKADTVNPHHKLVTVYYAALNFRDIMLASGRLPSDAIPGTWIDRDKLLGLEYVGRLPCGKRVMGDVWGGGLATTVVVDDRFLHEVPDHLSMEEAATIPIAYVTAYHSLCSKGQIQKGEKVLIHSGTGAVGQAAIQLSLAWGCEVFTTVGTKEKREFLKERFPSIPDDHIASSRSTNFELQFMKVTKGKGVDIVLNSLAEDKLQASIRCMADHGRFLEIGKFDMSKNTAIGMMMFLKSITFHGILLDAYELGFTDNPGFQAMKKFMVDETLHGMIRPLHRTVFPIDQVENAFRYMSKGNHIGKVLIEVRKEESALLCLPKPIQVMAVCRSYCHPAHSYLITGGLGGFGFELAKFLVKRGATKLILTSRTGNLSGYQKRCIAKFERKNVQVLISTRDLSESYEADLLIDECQAIGRLGGIFHLAMALRDAMFENQTPENFKEVAKMKYLATRNLDKITRQKCSEDLRWFVVFSSMTAGRGNAGQTSYGWGNSAMERIVEKRRFDGFSGIAIQWGAIGDVGIVNEKFGNKDVVVAGTLPQRITNCMQCLDTFLTWNHPVVASYVRSANRKTTGVRKDIIEAVAKILGVTDVASLNMETRLSEFGIDSLMGVELRQLLENDFNIIISMKDIRTLTLGKLKIMAASGGSAPESTSTGVTNQKESNEIEKVAKIGERRNSEALTFHSVSSKEIKAIVWDDLVSVNDAMEGQPVFFTHAIEGVASPMKDLCALITCPAYFIQNSPSAPRDSIEALAAYYVQVMRKQQSNGPYRLVGYSYGACVAFEMACHLQAHGQTVNLVMIDGSHNYWKQFKEKLRGLFGVSNDQTAIKDNTFVQSELMISFAERYGCDVAQASSLRSQLYEADDWDQRIQLTSEALVQAAVVDNVAQISWLLESFLLKFIMADKYETSNKYSGDITLIRATNVDSMRETGDGRDYGLSAVVSGVVNINEVDGDHHSIIQMPAANHCARLINTCFS